MYLALIMKIFGTRLLHLKIIEILVMSLTNVFIFEIGNKVYSKECGITASFLYAFSIFNIAGSSIINNQHISTLFIVIAVYMFIKDKWYHYLLSGIFMGIANITRPSSIVFLGAFLIFLIWRLLINKFKDWKKILLALILVPIMAFSVLKTFDFIMIKQRLVPNSAINSNVKYFKLILGLHGGGIYDIPTLDATRTQVYFDLEKLNFDYDKYNSICKEYILSQITQNPSNTIKYVLDKMFYFCGAPDNQICFAGEKIQQYKMYELFEYYGYGQYVLLIFLSFLMIIKNIKDKYNLSGYFMLFVITFILYFCAHLLIEVQPRYRYDQYVMLSLISAVPLNIIFDKLSELFIYSKKKALEVKEEKNSKNV